MPVRPTLPAALTDWVRPKDLDDAGLEPELLQEITVLVEKPLAEIEPAPSRSRRAVTKVPETRHLNDSPEVQETWLEYLVEQWEPWAAAMREWQEVHRVYESVDFMRRRVEEAAERYECVVGVGLVQWRDSSGANVKRHLLTGAAEIEFDASRGVLSVVPAASFEAFKVELDMLDLTDQPRLEQSGVSDALEELDVEAWNVDKVANILREIANRTRGDAQVDERAIKPLGQADDGFRVLFAPALILRERRPTALDEIIDRLSGPNGDDGMSSPTAPWARLLGEGKDGSPRDNLPRSAPERASENADLPGRLYFPLQNNEEQRQIAGRLLESPCIVVKGPPGTGKSWTIANLMCHLLASGERVLVTAQTSKALTVLRDMLPQELQDLCVTAFGSTREDQRVLEQGVRGILQRRNNRPAGPIVAAEITQCETDLRSIEDQLALTERSLRECREAETHVHLLSGGYKGTAGKIAQRIEDERARFSWFSDEIPGQPLFPLTPEQVSLLADMHGAITPSFSAELGLALADRGLPSVDAFRSLIAEVNAAEKAAQELGRTADPRILAVLGEHVEDELRVTAATLRELDERASRASIALGDVVTIVLKDLLREQRRRWTRAQSKASRLLKQADEILARASGELRRVAFPPDARMDQLLADGKRRLEYFQQGGRRGFWYFQPRLVRETQYVEDRCLVDGMPPREIDRLQALCDCLELGRIVDDLKQVWRGTFDVSDTDLLAIMSDAREFKSELDRLVALVTVCPWCQAVFGFREGTAEKRTKCPKCGNDFEPRDQLSPAGLPCLPCDQLAGLVEHATRMEWMRAISGELAARRAVAAKKPLDDCRAALQAVIEAGGAHPCVTELAGAVDSRNPAGWALAVDKRDALIQMKARLHAYEGILRELEGSCPHLVSTMRQSQGCSEWRARIHDLENAWAWASAAGWLREVTSADRYEDLIATSHRLQKRVEEKIERIAALRAWTSFFARLDETTVQNLMAWIKAVDRIGKGTGKFAHRHRRTARKYLGACIPQIPAWVMPLHKVWETVEAQAGLFDTIIIDEASQAGIESLLLFLLAKRVIVVGDDQQNSPEAVGVKEDDIARLIRRHLGGFAFGDEFRPDTSLFDHAIRSFGNLISLREHFRCVPEIIRFSNDLCYRDAPLIPLRQAPPQRLPPLRASFVAEGKCDGDGQRIHNRAEAEKLVRAIRECLDDDAFEGKSMGVIVLQGHAQAELIASLLAEELEPKLIEERRLRCGVPATFQGDQRDVIFLSLVIAPNVPTRALNRLPDQRRFNVAMSRARDQVWLFHSVQQHDLSPDCLRRRLIGFVQSPWKETGDGVAEERDRLEREVRRRPRRPGEQPEPYESWFEVDVALELLRRGYRVRAQYEVAHKRIDLVVEGLENRLAVECDGDAWHGPDRYEQDMVRQRQLERAGWTFVRIRESEFYTERSRAVDEILRACGDLGIQSVDKETAPTPEATVAIAAGDARDDTRAELSPASQVECEPPEDVQETEQGPFTGYSPELGFPDPREAAPANVRSALRTIVEKDGPLSRASVCRLYVEGCPYVQRASKTVRQILNRALGIMLRSGEICQEDQFGDGSPEGQIIWLSGTPRVRLRPAGRRDLLEIPAAEILVVLDRIHPSNDGRQPDEQAVLRALLEYYDYTRLTAIRRKYLNRVLDLWRAARSAGP